MAQKPSIPKGTRDFNATEVAKREYIINIIKTQFQHFGYQPIETPSFEKSTTLVGKYGDEGDRLIFNILNSGSYLNKVSDDMYSQKREKTLTPLISGKALRYDLTVPFARYVAQHKNNIILPYKRYQIQPVWRADRPQKGRYREFYQCDADVVGSKSLFQDVECVQLFDAVFTNLNLDAVTIKINHRCILSGIAEVIGAEDKITELTVALDKLDKVGKDKVIEEMTQKGFPESGIEKLDKIFELDGNFKSQIEHLKSLLTTSETATKGITDLEFIYENITTLGLQSAKLQLDVTLARGLNYYTGAIFEVVAPPTVSIGSIGGGGRYDNLTAIFGLKDVSGIGISFGLERIYLVLDTLDLFPKTIINQTKVLFINFETKGAIASLKAINKLRQLGINTELYPDSSKMRKQMTYANKREIPFVVLLGEDELSKNEFKIKNMKTGEQHRVNFEEMVRLLTNN